MPATLATKQAATRLQVSPNTLRNWSEQYRDFLSATAQPGVQPERRFTEQDVTILTYIKQLRSEGMKEPEIIERLHETTFSAVEVLEPPSEALQPAPISVEAPSPAQESLQPAPAALVALDDLRNEFRASIESLRAEQRAAWWYIAVGIVIGLGLAAVFELAAIVASRAH